jgi:tetratricopeptide (TPR) repeat protein
MHEANLPLEQVAAKFQELALRYQRLLESARTLQSDDPEVQALKTEAAAAIEVGPSSYHRAEELLERAEAIDREATVRLTTALEKRRLNAAVSRAQRGELSLLRLDYESATGHFKEAAEIAPPSHPEVRIRYRTAYANALCDYGTDRGINRALEDGIDVWKSLVVELPRDRVPLEWAMTQNNLGNALWTLGEREAGTTRLEEAVEAYRNALLEYARDRVALQWATIQNNLGNALRTLGEREKGTARLEEAVAAYHNALLEYTRDRVPLQWAITENNLGNALWTLGEREAGTARLEEAVEAYRNALLEYARDRVPLHWACRNWAQLRDPSSLFCRESHGPKGPKSAPKWGSGFFLIDKEYILSNNSPGINHDGVQRGFKLVPTRPGHSFPRTPAHPNYLA